MAVKIRVSSQQDNVPSRDHVIAACNKFDLIFVGISNGKVSIPSEETKVKFSKSRFLPAALRAVQICRYLVYSEADFEVFRPAGATRCTDGGEIWHGGGDLPKVPSSMPNFTPIGATTRV